MGIYPRASKRGDQGMRSESRYERAESLYPIVTYPFASIERGEVRRNETVQLRHRSERRQKARDKKKEVRNNVPIQEGQDEVN